MNSKQCHKLNVHLHKVFLSRMGVDYHLPLVYRYAPHWFQGSNSLHIEVTHLLKSSKLTWKVHNYALVPIVTFFIYHMKNMDS